MKTSTPSTNGMPRMHAPQQQDETLLSALRRGLRTAHMKLDRMGAAIALGEAGDLQGAKELRERHAEYRA